MYKKNIDIEPVFPLRPYVVKLAQHFEKLSQQILWEWVKKNAFSW